MIQCHPDISFLCNSNNIIDKVIKSTYPIRPTAVIVYGAPGSGKSIILTKVLSARSRLTSSWDFNIDIHNKPSDYCSKSMESISLSESAITDKLYDYNIVPILHDEILSSIPSYKPIQESFIKRINQISSDNIEDYTSIAEEYEKIYNTYKECVYLITSRLIDSCLSNKRNILIETTGNSIDYMEETIKKIKGNGYYVLCLFPFSELDVIYKRIINRAKLCGRIITKRLIDSCYINAIENFFKLSLKCDEVSIIDSSIEFNEDTVLYYKKYENYKICVLLNYNLIKIYEYFNDLFNSKVYHGNDKYKLSRLHQTMKLNEVRKMLSE